MKRVKRETIRSRMDAKRKKLDKLIADLKGAQAEGDWEAVNDIEAAIHKVSAELTLVK